MTVEELKSKVNELFLQARNQKLIDVEKKRLLARAMAYYNELQFAKDGKVEVDEQRVRNVQQRNMNNAALRLAEVRGELGLLADDTPERLNEDMVKEDQGASRYDNKDSEASDIAENIRHQMSSTWRVRGNSKEFNAVKRAMQAVASAKDGPTQLDNYVAAETLRMYIGKNLNKAKSAVGMTRMACALAFMKQTMPEKDFKAYCTNLNLLRRIPYTKENGELQFDLKDPRCIDPDMIGTVGEVYKTVRERFHEYAKDEEKKIDPRDLARLTALKNLQAKSSKGENLVVEHEALEAEIEKVMKDRRFQEALRTKQRDELIDMAWYGNLNKIEGYVAPLPQEQQKRIDDDRTKKEDARKQKIQSIMDIKAKQEKQVKDALDKEEKRIIEEKNRIAKEAELKKQQEELLKIQKPHSQMLREIMPEITKMADTFDSVFSQLDNDHVEQYTELAAKLVALGEIGYKNPQAKPEEKEADPTVNLGKFNERVEQLKNDKYVQQLGKTLKEDPETYKYIQAYMKKAESLPEKDKEIYPSVAVSKNLYKDFAEHYGIIKKKVKKEDKLHTVEEGYKSLEEKVDDVIAGGKNYKEAGKIIALGLALREVEQKGGGLQATWTEKSFKNIYNKYMADSAMDTIGQTMSGLGMQQRLKKDLQGKPDRVKEFIDLAQEQYKKILDDREKRKDKGKGKPKEKQGEIQKEIKGP